jgi:hypothetical protein
MDSSAFHKMDMKKYKKILDKSKDLNGNHDIDWYEEKYKTMISKYSNAYLQGSKWYVGPSFKKYILNKSFNNLYDPRLEYIRYILLTYN